MQVVLNVKGSSRTTGSDHNREVVALCLKRRMRQGGLSLNNVSFISWIVNFKQSKNIATAKLVAYIVHVC